MINIGICDDEPSVLKSIYKITEATIINTELDGEIVIATNNQNEIYKLIKNYAIDLLFLDIDFNSEGKNGVEFALELRRINKDFKLVFITGHFEYAMLAYKCKTFDYLLKPADTKKMTDILNRLKEEMSFSELGFFKVNKDYTVRMRDILYIERNKSKATIYTKDSIYETNSSLKNISQELPNNFVRVHRSYIVNSDHISKIDNNDKLIYFDNNLSCPRGNFEITLN